MSTSHQRKRMRERGRYDTDYDATKEANAISNSLQTRTIDFGKNLRHYYFVDGQRFQTGQKHRRVAVGMTHVDRIPKHRHKQKSKHIDLRSRAVRQRVENPELYKGLDARRVQRLLEYKTGRARERMG